MIFSAGFVHKESVNDLLKECAKMSKFDHPNVLKLSGVCLDGGPAPYIIMPFMENGCLLSYLREEKESLVEESDANQENLVSHRVDFEASSLSCLDCYNTNFKIH